MLFFVLARLWEWTLSFSLCRHGPDRQWHFPDSHPRAAVHTGRILSPCSLFSFFSFPPTPPQALSYPHRNWRKSEPLVASALKDTDDDDLRCLENLTPRASVCSGMDSMHLIPQIAMFTYKLVHDIVQIKGLVKKMEAFTVVWEIPIILWIREPIIAFVNDFNIFFMIKDFCKLHITSHSQHMSALPLTHGNVLICR